MLHGLKRAPSASMQPAPYRPSLHFFVCNNRRPADHPLGPGCGARGESVFAGLKERVAIDRDYQRVWVTQTGCIGVCPRRGATVAIYPEGRILTEVGPEDVDPLYDEAVVGKRAAGAPR